MCLFKKLKPDDFPPIYGYVDEFYREVNPRLESLLNRRVRRLTLSQTFGTAYNAFHPFLLDYPVIRKCISETDRRDKNSVTQFWECLRNDSVYPEFESSRKKINLLHENSKLKCGTVKNFGPRSSVQKIALATMENRLPNHFLEKIFTSAFSREDLDIRSRTVMKMQEYCSQLEQIARLHNSEILDLFNLTVYKNGLAYHCYLRISEMLNAADEHAKGFIKLNTSIPNYAFVQWKDVTTWFGVYKAVGTASKEIGIDADMNRFFVTVFCLRDWEIGDTSFQIKTDLLQDYLNNPEEARKKLMKLIDKFPFAAPYWVKQYLKLKD